MAVWVCRSSGTDYCGATITGAPGPGMHRDLFTAFTVNQYIVSGPPAAYLCSLAPACSNTPFGAASSPTYDFSFLGEVASTLGTNECHSVWTRHIPDGVVREAGVCGELSRAVIECPRMPLVDFNNSEVEVLAIKRDLLIGHYWESLPADGNVPDGWLE